MYGLDILLLIGLSLILFKIAQFIQAKTKVLPLITYLILGVIFGSGGLALLNENFYFFDNVNYFPNISRYSTFMLYLMFIGAGFSLNIKKDKDAPKKEKNPIATRLMTIPVYIESIVVGTLMYAFSKLGIFGFELTYWECLFLAVTLAMASPANVIPLTMKKMGEGKTGNKGIMNSVILASASDFITPLPIMLIALILLLRNAVGLELSIPLAIIGSLLVLITLTAFGVAFGFLLSKILSPLGKKYAESGKPTTYFSLAYYLIFVVVLLFAMEVPAIASALGLFGIFFALFFGAGINSFDSTGLKAKVRLDLTKFFALFGTPIVFTKVGAGISLLVLADIKNVILILIILAISCLVKVVVSYYSIKNIEGLDKGDIRYAAVCAIPKGIAIINFSLVLQPMIASYDSYYLTFMMTLASISVLITLPIGITLINKIGDEELKGTVEKNV